MAEEIYALTERGKAELQGGSTSCSTRELELLVLVDGKSGVAALAARAPDVPPAEVAEVLGRLASRGLVQRQRAGEFASGYSMLDATGLSAAREADAGTAELRRNGFFVSIARRAASPRPASAQGKPRILIVEDDAVLSKMLGHLMSLEGFEARAVALSAEIEAELAGAPLPDAVLLDVGLPDADGFEVLRRIRRLEAWREVPVIMVTGRATREAVMQGLAAGAAGYVTKPIQYDALAKGVRAVLGLSAADAGEAELPADDTVSELRKEYRRGLAAKVARAEALARELAPGLPARGAFEELKRLAHSMAGSAPTFGLPEVGRAARALEQALEALQAKPDGDVGEAKAKVGALRSAANAARS